MVGLKPHITLLLDPGVLDSTLVQNSVVHGRHPGEGSGGEGGAPHAGAPGGRVELVGLGLLQVPLGVDVLGHVRLVGLVQLLQGLLGLGVHLLHPGLGVGLGLVQVLVVHLEAVLDVVEAGEVELGGVPRVLCVGSVNASFTWV